MRSASVYGVSHISRLRRKTSIQMPRKKPSDLASTHPPFARLSLQRLSTMMTMMVDLSCCVIRGRYLQVLRSSESLKLRLIFSFLSIGRQSRHSDGFVLRTFQAAKPGLRCTQHATLVCESGNPHGYSFCWTFLVWCWLWTKVKVPTTLR